MQCPAVQEVLLNVTPATVDPVGICADVPTGICRLVVMPTVPFVVMPVKPTGIRVADDIRFMPGGIFARGL